MRFKTRIAELWNSLRRKDSFAQNLGVVFSAKFMVTIISFIFIPILSRIYNPEAYGVFSYFNSVVVIYTTIAIMAFPAALVIPKKESDYYGLAAISLTLSVAWSLILLFIITLFKSEILLLINYPALGNYIYLLPASILVSGSMAVFTRWNIRRKMFRLSSHLEVWGNLSIRILSLVLGFLSNGYFAFLIISDFVGKLLTNLVNVNIALRREYKQLAMAFNLKRILETFRTYKRYPLFILPGELINRFGGYAPVLILGSFFGTNVLGNFTMAMSLLNVPVQIIGNSLASVFLKEATDLYYKDKDKLIKITSRLFRIILGTSVFPFAILAVFAPNIFRFILGKQWELAGIFAGFMSFYFYIYLSTFPLTSIFQVYKKENRILQLNSLVLVLGATSLSIGVYFNNYLLAIILYSAGNFLAYTIQGVLIFRLLKIQFITIFIKYTVVFLFISILIPWIKSYI